MEKRWGCFGRVKIAKWREIITRLVNRPGSYTVINFPAIFTVLSCAPAAANYRLLFGEGERPVVRESKERIQVKPGQEIHHTRLDGEKDELPAHRLNEVERCRQSADPGAVGERCLGKIENEIPLAALEKLADYAAKLV